MDEDLLVPAPIPVLDETDAAAVFALCVRMAGIDLANARDKELIERLENDIVERSKPRSKYLTAFDAFGFDIDSNDLWSSVSAALGHDRYLQAITLGYPEFLNEYDPRNFGPNLNLVEKSRADEFTADQFDPDHKKNPPKVSTAILEYLRSVGRRGAQVDAIKAHLLRKYGLDLHEKTPGMTLYRLSKDGLVRREGRTWLAIEMSDGAEISAIAPVGAITNTPTDQ